MTIGYPFTLAQLAQILSALENERRNPNTKRFMRRCLQPSRAVLPFADSL